MDRKDRIPNTRLSRFYDESDFNFDVGISQDIIEQDSNFRVILYRVDRVNTTFDDVYGESKSNDLVYLPPVELNVLLTVNAATNDAYNKNQGTLKFEAFGNLEFIVFLKELDKKNVEIKYGDIIGYPESENQLKFFSVSNPNYITSSNQKHYNFKSYYKKIICVTIEGDQFKG
jgi:hypothetical protein